MQDRYPYIGFVVSVAPGLAGVIAAVVLLGGLVNSCQIGGVAGFFQFLVTIALAGVAFVGAMVWVESLRVFLDIEENTRQLITQTRPGDGPAPPPSSER